MCVWYIFWRSIHLAPLFATIPFSFNANRTNILDSVAVFRCFWFVLFAFHSLYARFDWNVRNRIRIGRNFSRYKLKRNHFSFTYPCTTSIGNWFVNNSLFVRSLKWKWAINISFLHRWDTHSYVSFIGHVFVRAYGHSWRRHIT